MDWLFDELGLPSDKRHRQSVDEALRDVLALEPGAQCPQVWATVKRLSSEERAALVPHVAEALRVANE
jgi:hypothetical protein